MKIRAFQIKNYRSIVDSGICYLSHDNITALIGQNESGKTSVLEALRSFYEGTITDDILRSDQSFPEITCIFEFYSIALNKIIDESKIPESIREPMMKKNEITVVRKWTSARKNSIFVSEPETNLFFDDLRKKFNESDTAILEAIPELQKNAESVQNELENEQQGVNQAKTDINKLYSSIEETKRVLKKTNRPDIQIETKRELESLQQKFAEAEEYLRKKLSQLDELRLRLQTISGKLEKSLHYNDIASRVNKLQEEVGIVTKQILDTEHQYELCSSEREGRNIFKRLEGLRNGFEDIHSELKELSDSLALNNKVTHRVLQGQKIEDAITEASAEIAMESNFLTPEEIGMKVFNNLPVFEFFEDFSSLLPNKIDLEDLLNENVLAEGHKAAKNFLCIAGLNADFFREKNHRILKQKIENLNSDITIDFQDYWRQKVGKNDKIRLNFELEHYDYTVPEKSGKPYLEFWIKDKQERLYPKQRSRGVRWFLSFYLELKATAKSGIQNRVLLIDEPGLSLHARAQEDVLKVFEDLRENLQIIYCTHSPHLIDLHKLYRIMAVQRANEVDEKSETIVLDARRLNGASADTLSPIYSLMGTRLNDRQFIYPRNNIIVEDIVTFYYLDTMARLAGHDALAHFIPASSTEGISLIANLLFGWKIDFGLLIFDTQVNHEIALNLQKLLFLQREKDSERKIQIFKDCPQVEDLFSTIDFKRFILNQRIGITISNAEYIETNRLSRIILAGEFCSKIESENIVFGDFDEETQNNFEKLLARIREINQ